MRSYYLFSRYVFLFVLWPFSPGCHNPGAAPKPVNDPRAADSTYSAQVLPESGSLGEFGFTLFLHDNTPLRISRYLNLTGGAISPRPRRSIDLKPESGKDDTTFYTYQVPNGEFEVLSWRWSEKMQLSPGSTVKFTDTLPGGGRTFYVQGQALFNPDDGDSGIFFVRLPGHMTVSIHGQRVYIDNFAINRQKIIVAYQGGVEIKGDGYSNTLPENNGISIDADFRIHSIEDHDQLMTKDLRTQFYFKNKSLPEVVDEVGRWYDRDILVEGKDVGKLITGSGNRDDSIENVLKQLSSFFEVKLSAGKYKGAANQWK
ncbi:MAG: DUF4974 domain-containing protein [Puia sp.]|nr:DUF4974 domain-containing protein [Puia sp.]